MNSTLLILLRPSPEQVQRLRHLQSAFAQLCNALAVTVRDRRCWNRVTLHHLTYREMRERHPAVGSQMVCNAIYAVCRTARMVFQHPESPFHLSRLEAGERLPLLKFDESCPVFFDRHTLSYKDGQLSMYTLDGRIRFRLLLSPEEEQRLREERLRDVQLSRTADDGFQLLFCFADDEEAAAQPAARDGQAAFPPYLAVEESA